MTHTPGEWKFARTDNPGRNEENNHLIYNEQKRHIAEVFQYQNHDFNIRLEEAEANARLIAAAPQLLAALEELVQLVEDDNYVPDSFTLQPAKQALAAAKNNE